MQGRILAADGDSDCDSDRLTFQRSAQTSDSQLGKILSQLELPLVILGSDGRLLGFTSTAAAAVQLTAADLGRPLKRQHPSICSDSGQLIGSDEPSPVDDLDDIDVAVITVDNKGDITGWNELVTLWFGCHSCELQGQPLGRLFQLAPRFSLMLEVIASTHRRVGQELHDCLGQELTSLMLLGRSLQLRLQKLNVAEVREARMIVELAQKSLDEVRRMGQRLFRTSCADDLSEELLQLAAATQERTAIACECECPEQGPVLDPFMTLQLRRIAQEAVNNAVKHSKCNRIHVQFHASETALVLRVTDNGTGIAPHDHSGGLGLQIMNNRARSLGGTLTLHAVAQGGTEVCCRVPLRPSPIQPQRECPSIESTPR